MIEATEAQLERDEAQQRARELHPALRRLFADLERRELSWVLLRLPTQPAAPAGDVDLLVAPAHAQALRKTAAEHGFVAIPGWESGRNLLLLCYDDASDCWLMLDVVTEVAFRHPRAWQLRGGSEGVLARRQIHDGVALPSEDDQFWLLLLHCLLDKRSVPEGYRPLLESLAPLAWPSELAEAVFQLGQDKRRHAANAEPQSGLGSSLLAAAAASEWAALSDLGVPLELSLKRTMTVRERAASLLAGLARASRKPLLVRRRRGLSIALLGPNGVGKSTAAAGLQRSFPFDSRVIYMGVWKGVDAKRAAIVRVVEIITRPVRIWSRYLLALYHQLRGRLVIFDRFVYEALLPPTPPMLAAKRAYFWVLAHLIPAPSVIAVLDVPGAVAYRRKQENPPEELERERRIYAHLESRPRVKLVDATADTASIRADLAAIVWSHLIVRWQRKPEEH